MDNITEFFAYAIVALIVAFFISVWIWLFLHALKRPDLSIFQKLLWILFMFLGFPWGSLAYYFLSRPKYAR